MNNKLAKINPINQCTTVLEDLWNIAFNRRKSKKGSDDQQLQIEIGKFGINWEGEKVF